VTTCPPALQWTGVPADTKQLVLIMDDLVARKQMNSKQEAGWLWLPLIIGLIIGVTVAAMTDQWCWSTVGVLGGAAFGWVSYARMR
jgi:1,4-dihydroxy-2-naphthoate octaprenyltransferase